VSAELQRLSVLMSGGNFAELEHQTLELLRRQPQSGVMWQLLAVALTSQGKDPLHALTRAVQCAPEDATAHNNLGNALARAGQFDQAIASYRRALTLRPQFVEASNNLVQAYDSLGSALLVIGRADEAVASFRHALQIDPRFFEAHNNLGNALRGAGQIDQALASYDRALQIMPRFAEAHCNRASALRLLGRGAEARTACRTALEIKPRFASALIVLGELSADGGDFFEAERFFKQGIAIEPELVEAWAGLAGVRTMTHDDADWLVQARAIAERPMTPRKQAVLEFAIGKCLDDLREFEQAFAHFRRANEAAKRCRPLHDRRGLTDTVNSIIRDYDKSWINKSHGHASDSPRPVFIVGMLRSGTTLAEQILASHPAVLGAGELSFWGSAFSEIRAVRHSAQERDMACGRLTGNYLRLLRDLSLDALRVVDKMPTNFAFLGLIHALFPQARIIHMQRNPLDTCLSIYFQNFDTAVTYANDLEDLAHYHEEYIRLMNHWRSSLPSGLMLEVPYEDLVIDQEAWSRKMVEFVGLPWDSKCLDFHLTKRTVVTASKWQVRQKINSLSIGRWRNYGSQLGPLRRLVSSARADQSSCE
jgi:tetratricopeptide (TPR) repeat protein